MNTLVQARINAETLSVLDRFAAHHSLNRSDAIRLLILQCTERNKLADRFEKVEKVLANISNFSIPKNIVDVTQISIDQKVTSIQKTLQILIENVYLPAAPMDRKSAIRVAAEILKTDH